MLVGHQVNYRPWLIDCNGTIVRVTLIHVNVIEVIDIISNKLKQYLSIRTHAIHTCIREKTFKNVKKI